MKTRERLTQHFLHYPVFLLALSLILAGAAGCSDDDDCGNPISGDFTPPGIPSGVTSITGDGAVFVRWIPNKEPDLAGYRIWLDIDGDEEFQELDRVSAFEDGVYQDNETPSAADDFLEYFDDLGYENNGTYNSYAISAFDDAGNESDLSWEYVVDVPRPEGYDLRLWPRGSFPASSGYDLSSLSEVAQMWSDPTTDFWYEVDAGQVDRFVVPIQDAWILDAGFQGYDGYAGLDGVDFAPRHGWSAEGVVEAIPGHTYVLRIRNGPTFGDYDYYAKVWLGGFENGAALLWWAYQEVEGETQFSQPRPNSGESKEFVSGEEVRR